MTKPHRPAHGPFQLGRNLRRLEENDFLAGHRSRVAEFVRVLRIGLELIKGFRALFRIGPAITIFGSARLGPEHPAYEKTRMISERLARAGFAIMTGGGPGLMEAANKGAQEGGGLSIGCTIDLQREMSRNAYLDRVVHFTYFFVRKLMLVKYSYGFVIMQGGSALWMKCSNH